MRLALPLLAALVFAPCVSPAGENTLEKLESASKSHGWEAVGLLLIEGQSSCTGVLVRSDIVLTAGHCLYDAASGHKADPAQVEFRAGWRNGRAVAYRTGRRAVVDPDFMAGQDGSLRQRTHDIALLQLSSPIPATHAAPFRVGGTMRAGQEVSIVSYGQGRNDAPSRERRCSVLREFSNMLAMDCSVVHGSSGAPVFIRDGGRERVAAVVSALARSDGKQVSVAVETRGIFSSLLSDLRSSGSAFTTPSAGARRLTPGSGHRAGGARFLKP